MTSKDAMPSTTDFERALKTNNLYGNLSLCKFLLMEIENGNGKETLNTETLTIEHIMPQALSSDWKHISDQDHEQYLHTLGNLSVSGYNSELSNKSFSEKKKIIAENSKAVILNSDVLSKDSWNIDSIKSRSGRLAQILMQNMISNALPTTVLSLMLSIRLRLMITATLPAKNWLLSNLTEKSTGKTNTL